MIVRASGRPPPPLTWPHLHRLQRIAAADPRDTALFHLMLYAGLPPRELVGTVKAEALGLDNYDPRHGLLRVGDRRIKFGRGSATQDALDAYLLARGSGFMKMKGRPPKSLKQERALALFPLTQNGLFLAAHRWAELSGLLLELPTFGPMSLVWTHRDYLDGAEWSTLLEAEILIQFRSGATGEKFIPYLAYLESDGGTQSVVKRR